jgi:hypothetical protein
MKERLYNFEPLAHYILELSDVFTDLSNELDLFKLFFLLAIAYKGGYIHNA